MEKLMEILPIILLGIGQIMQTMIYMNLTKRVIELERMTGKTIPWEVLNGNQE